MELQGVTRTQVILGTAAESLWSRLSRSAVGGC